jgi:DNA-binding MarR family transcriptional regulator
MSWIADLFEGLSLAPELITKLDDIELQFSLLESEVVQLRIQVERLTDEKAAIEREKQQFQQENEDLRKTREFPHTDPLTPLEAAKRKALLRLVHFGPQSLGTLIDQMQLGPENGSIKIKELVDGGYIELPPLGPGTRKATITEKGRELLATHFLI